MINRVSVSHITTVHPPFDQRIFHRECYSLSKLGYDVTLLAFDNQTGPVHQNGITLRSLGHRYSGSPRARLYDRFSRANLAYHAAYALKQRIYHIHDPELIGTALRLKANTKAKVIYDCHEDNRAYVTQKRYIPKALRRIFAFVIDLYERLAAKRLDLIITADENTCKHFMELGARTEILYNFPRLDYFPDNLIPVTSPNFDLVYHGSLPPYHLETCFAIDDVLVRKGRRIRWMLFGDIHDIDWTRQQIAERNANTRIVLGGRIPHENVYEKVLEARIGIIPLPDLPKFQSNIPTKLFEFMALRMPSILSDLPPSRPFAMDGKCGIMVPPYDAHAYSKAIIWLLENPLICKAMGAEGRLRVEQKYNWGHEEEKLYAVYEELLGQ
jgi:glycosyltransferase involved in cell wall biosynthesis